MKNNLPDGIKQNFSTNRRYGLGSKSSLENGVLHAVRAIRVPTPNNQGYKSQFDGFVIRPTQQCPNKF